MDCRLELQQQRDLASGEVETVPSEIKQRTLFRENTESEIQTPVETGIKMGSAVSDLANISHQKGDVGLITLSKDKIEAMLSATGSLGSNFLFFTLGAALSIFLALKSGGVETSWRPIFWIGFIFALVLAGFFTGFTVVQELRKRRFRKEIRNAPSTLLR